MLKFNIKEHELKELEKYGFVKKMKKHQTHYGKMNDIEEYCYSYYYEWSNEINDLSITYNRAYSDWIYDVDLLQLDMFESDYEMGVSLEALDVVYDLIKDGLIIKE